MNSPVKLSRPDIAPDAEFVYPDVWQPEGGSGWSRLRIGARGGEITLMLELCQNFKGPFGILYVLLVSRLGRRAGRYQSPHPIGFPELESFLHTYREFLEQDGRHHVWVMSLSGEGQLIFDNHNYLYAYGDPNPYQSILEEKGFTRGVIEIPAPHCHHYHPAFDRLEDALMAHWEWQWFPLAPDDDP